MLKPDLIKDYNKTTNYDIVQMNQKLVLAVLGTFVFSLIFVTNPVFADQTLVYHGKNVIESPPEFAGTTFHFLIRGNDATVIFPGQHGIEVTRMDITPSETCVQTKHTFCFDGLVTAVKNPQMHQPGDKVSITLDLENKKQVGTAQSGPMIGMTVTTNIERMNIKSNAPYTLAVTREGGFAGFAPKTMTFDSSSGMITITEGESTTNVPLDANAIQEIDQIFKKSNLLNMVSKKYLPNQGAADYFSYNLELTQGVFQTGFSWTDASDGVPEALRELQNKIWTTGELNIPIPTDIVYGELAIIEIAKTFVLLSPTFAFDGIEDTLEFGPITIMESFPEQYALDIKFTSSHGGFGDRTDQMVTQALSPHTMSVVISGGNVISAVTDDTWDELNNQYIEPQN